MKKFAFTKKLIPLLIYSCILIALGYFIIADIMEVKLMRLFFTVFLLVFPVIIYIFFSRKKTITILLLIALFVANLITFPFAGGAFYKNYSHINYYFPPLPKQKYTRDHYVFMDKYIGTKTVYYSEEDFMNKNHNNHHNVFYTYMPDKYNLIYQPDTPRKLSTDQVADMLNKYNFYEFYHTSEISYYFYVEDDFTTVDDIVIYVDKNDNAYFFPLNIEKEL